MLRQRLTTKELERRAPFYKYDETGVPQSFLDINEFVRYLKRTDNHGVLTKLGVIQEMLFKRHHEIKRENRFIEWIKEKEANGWQFEYSVPRYRNKFEDPKKHKMYSDFVIRHSKLENKEKKLGEYYRLMNKRGEGQKEMPPAMAGMIFWREYFEYCHDLRQLDRLDNAITQILNTYHKLKKENDDSRQRTIDYLNSRRANTDTKS